MGTLKPLKYIANAHAVGIMFTQHHNVQGRGRGSTQFDGGVDILLDLRRVESEDGEGNDNVRLLEAIGRGVHHKSLIKLTDDGYESLTEIEGALKDITKSARVVLRFMPVIEAEGRTITQLHEVVSGTGKKMSHGTVERAAKELVAATLAYSKGEGGKGDPRRFWRQEPEHQDKEPEAEDEICSSLFSDTKN